MKIEWRLFAGFTAFYALVAVIYGYLAAWEPVGTTALALSAGLGSLVTFYIWFTGRRVGLRPEDRLDGEIHEAAGEIGFFSPHSWWPLFVAASFSLIFVGLIVGYWLALIGVSVLIFTLIGLLFEYQRGDRAVH